MTPEPTDHFTPAVSSPSYSSNHQPSDVDLWHLLRKGNREALGHLYDRHASLVYGLSLKVLGHPQEAEDLTQDIFMGLSARSYDPNRGSFRTFLMILTRSRAIDRVRSRQTVQRSKKAWQATVLTETPAVSTDSMMNAEQSKAVSSALSQISELEQEVLRLAYYEGLTQAAIAQQLDEPLGTVKSRARRGLLKLRQLLQIQGEV